MQGLVVKGSAVFGLSLISHKRKRLLVLDSTLNLGSWLGMLDDFKIKISNNPGRWALDHQKCPFCKVLDIRHVAANFVLSLRL